MLSFSVSKWSQFEIHHSKMVNYNNPHLTSAHRSPLEQRSKDKHKQNQILKSPGIITWNRILPGIEVCCNVFYT